MLYNRTLFDDEGLCPYNLFLEFGIENSITTEANRVFNLLKDRICYMVYPDGYDRSYPFSSIVTLCMLDTDDEIFRFAKHLKVIIPNCKYPKRGRKIRLHDVVYPLSLKRDPNSLDDEKLFQNGTWHILVRNNCGGDAPVDVFISRIDRI